MNIKYPELIVNLSKADYTFGVESKVHGQMKQHFFPKRIRQEFTAAIQQAKSFEEQITIAKQWVTVV